MALAGSGTAIDTVAARTVTAVPTVAGSPATLHVVALATDAGSVVAVGVAAITIATARAGATGTRAAVPTTTGVTTTVGARAGAVAIGGLLLGTAVSTRGTHTQCAGVRVAIGAATATAVPVTTGRIGTVAVLRAAVGTAPVAIAVILRMPRIPVARVGQTARTARTRIVIVDRTAAAAAIPVSTLAVDRIAITRPAVLTGPRAVAGILIVPSIPRTVVATTGRTALVVLDLTTATAVAVGTGVVRVVAVLGAAVLASAVLTEVHRNPGVPRAVLTAAVGAIPFIGLATTTARAATVVLTGVAGVAILGAGIVARSGAVATVIRRREGQPTASRSITDKAAGSIRPRGLTTAR